MVLNMCVPQLAEIVERKIEEIDCADQPQPAVTNNIRGEADHQGSSRVSTQQSDLQSCGALRSKRTFQQPPEPMQPPWPGNRLVDRQPYDHCAQHRSVVE